MLRAVDKVKIAYLCFAYSRPSMAGRDIVAIGNRESMFALNLKVLLFRPSLNTFEYT